MDSEAEKKVRRDLPELQSATGLPVQDILRIAYVFNQFTYPPLPEAMEKGIGLKCQCCATVLSLAELSESAYWECRCTLTVVDMKPIIARDHPDLDKIDWPVLVKGCEKEENADEPFYDVEMCDSVKEARKRLNDSSEKVQGLSIARVEALVAENEDNSDDDDLTDYAEIQSACDELKDSVRRERAIALAARSIGNKTWMNFVKGMGEKQQPRQKVQKEMFGNRVSHSSDGLQIDKKRVCDADLALFANFGEYVIIIVNGAKIILHKSVFDDVEAFRKCLETTGISWTGKKNDLRMLKPHFFNTPCHNRVQVISKLGFVNNAVVWSKSHQVQAIGNGFQLVSADNTNIYVDERPEKVKKGEGEGNKQEKRDHPGTWLDKKMLTFQLHWSQHTAIQCFRDAHDFIRKEWKGQNYAQYFFGLAHLGFGLPNYERKFIPVEVSIGESTCGKSLVAKTKMACLFPYVEDDEYFIITSGTTVHDVQQRMKWGNCMVLDDYDRVAREKLNQRLQEWTRNYKILLTVAQNPQKEAATTDPQVERTILRTVNWTVLQSNNGQDVKKFDDNYSNILRGLYRVAPVLPVFFDLNNPSSQVTNEEWNEIENHLTKKGVLDHSRGGKPYLIRQSLFYYREWLQFGLCQAQMLGNMNCSEVFGLFKQLLGVTKPSGMPPVHGNEVDDFTSISKVDAHNGKKHFELFLVEIDKEKYWIVSDLREKGALKRKDNPFTKTCYIRASSKGIRKLIDAGARSNMGSVSSLLVSIEDEKIASLLWLQQ